MYINFTKLVLFSYLVFSILLLFPKTNVYAATCTWTGASDVLWSNNANWSGCGGGVPGVADDVVFPLGASNLNNTNDIVGATFNSITISDPFYVLNGNSFSVVSGITINPLPAATIHINNDVILSGSQSIITSISGTSHVYFNGNVAMNGAFTGFDIDSGTTLHLVNTVSGPSALTKSNSGILVLRGNNTYSGNTSINDGTVNALHSNALGSVTGSTSIGSTATLYVGGGLSISENFTIVGGSGDTSILTYDKPALGVVAGDNLLSGSISIAADTKIQAEDGSLTFSGNITETGASIIYAKGELTFSGTNSFSELNLSDTTSPASNITITGNQPTTPVSMVGGKLTISNNSSVGNITSVSGLAVADIYVTEPGIGTIGTIDTGNLSFGGPNNLWFDIHAGIGSDILSVTGSVALSNLDNLMINNLGGTYTVGQGFTIIENDGLDSILNIFPGLPEGAFISVGGVNFSISYVGGINNNDVTLTVQSFAMAASTNAISSNVNPSVYGQNITFTANVTCSNDATGTVEFYDGAILLGVSSTDSAGVATFITDDLTAGNHSITAVFSGNSVCDTSTSSAISQDVDQATSTTTLASDNNPSNLGDSAIFAATVIGEFGAPLTGTVSFYDGATLLGTATLDGSGVAAFTTSALSAGNHDITAVYDGDINNIISDSLALIQIVNTDETVYNNTEPLSETGDPIYSLITLVLFMLGISGLMYIIKKDAKSQLS